MSSLARAREIFDFRVHGCHIAFVQRACTLFFRVSRVPQGCHRRDPQKQETHQTRDPPQPSLLREGVLLLISAYSIHSA